MLVEIEWFVPEELIQKIGAYCPEESLVYRPQLPSPRVEFCYPKELGSPVPSDGYIDDIFSVTFDASDSVKLIFASTRSAEMPDTASLESISTSWDLEAYQGGGVTIFNEDQLKGSFILTITGDESGLITDTIRGF